ncbi:hypothetical protein [Mycobacterium uberis]|uniref:hypothetical protein n=1 Tax=Mycobacterium uberis TaxID=2162698 RepID=UPI001FB4B3C1|nr:hypothetical protein [Mycobacterium uberis]
MSLFAQTVRQVPLTECVAKNYHVAVIDARVELAPARRVCRQLKANAPSVAVVGDPADIVAVDIR